MSGLENVISNEDKNKFKVISNKLARNISNNDIKDIEFLIGVFNNMINNKYISIYFNNEKDNIDNYLKNVLKKIILNMLSQSYIEDEKVNDSILNFLYSVVKLLSIYDLNEYSELANIIREIFLSEKRNFQYFHPKNGNINKMFWEFNNEYYTDSIKFREPVYIYKEGDKVDVLVEDDNKKADDIDRIVWMEGIIKKVDSKIYYITYNGEDDSKNEIYYPIGYPTVAFRGILDWKLKLKLGEKIDVYYKGNWVSGIISNIVKQDEKNGIPKIKYKVDFNIKYEKSFENVSEYIYYYSNRIQKSGSYTNKKKNKNLVMKNNDDIFAPMKKRINNIISYKSDEKENIVVGKMGNFSYNFAKLLKKLENGNIFNDYLKSLTNEKLIIPEVFYTIYTIFHSALNYLHTDFLKEKLDIFHKSYLNLLKMVNVDNEYLKIIKIYLKDMFTLSGRSFDSCEKDIEKVILDNFFDFMKSDKLEDRIKGIEYLNKKIDYNENENIAIKLKEFNIVDKIFGNNFNGDIVKKSEKIMEIMSRYSKLDDNDIKLIWESRKKCDVNVEKIIIDLLNKLIDNIDEKNTGTVYLINEIINGKEIPDDNVQKFIQKLARKTKINKFKMCEYYFSILMESNSLDLTNNNFEKFIQELSLNDHELRFKLFQLYKENLNINSHCLISYALMINLLNYELEYNKRISDDNLQFQSKNNKLMNFLLDTKRPLIEIFEKNLNNYLTEAKRNIDNIVNIYKFDHNDNMKIRLKFLYELTNIYQDYNFLPLLKKILLDEPIFPDDKKYFYVLLNDYCSNENDEINKNNQIRNDILQELYDILNNSVNEVKGKIYSYEEDKTFIKILSYKFSSLLELNINKINDEENFEIKCKSDENKDIIFEIIWNALFRVNDDKIIKSLMKNLLKISKEDHRDIIYKIYEQFEEINYRTDNMTNIINRCYKLLKLFFIETEKNLSIKIKPHFSLLKNCIIKFPLKIQNYIPDNNLNDENNEISYFFGNSSLNEVKIKLSDNYRIYIDFIETYYQEGDKIIFLDDTYNHKSLLEIMEEFNITLDNEPISSYIFFSKKKEEELIQGNELNPKFKNIIDKWFYVATKGKERLYPRNFVNFVRYNRIPTFFKSLKKNSNDYLTKEDIYKLYVNLIKTGGESKSEIINDLNIYGYDEYLMKTQRNSFVQKVIIDETKLFRYNLSNISKEDEKSNFYTDFINNYNYINPKIDHDLFFYLPTCTYYYEGILFGEKEDVIDNILNDENQCLMQLYYLIIIESFFQDIESQYIIDNDFGNKTISSLENLYDGSAYNSYKKQFFKNMINRNSYENLIKYVINIIEHKKYEKEKIYKECFIRSLKIIKILYTSLAKTKDFEIKNKISKDEQNIYYFDYDHIKTIFDDDNIKMNYNLSYPSLAINLFNYIISNFNNKDILEDSFFKECFELIIILISSNENYFSDDIKNNFNFSDFIKNNIILDSSFVIKIILSSLKYILVNPSESKYIEFLYNIFLSIFCPTNDETFRTRKNSDQYFELINEFIKFVYNDNNFRKKEIIENLIMILIDLINNKLNTNTLYEKVFVNYINIFNDNLLDKEQIRKIIFNYRTNDNFSLLSSIYHNIIKIYKENNFILLEDNESPELPTIQRSTINICKIFIIMCFEKEGINQNSITEMLSMYKEIQEFDIQKESNNNYQPEITLYNEDNNENITEKTCRFVGLKNLSNICYMNSIIQQLFMIPALKYAILGEGNISEDNAILRQLQNLFGYLELSKKSYFNPINLCLTNIFHNKPIQINIQQDSKEFYDSVCDCLETCFKNSKYKYIANEALMGYMSDSIKCESCNYTSNKFESFYDLSIEVKDVDNLMSSLEKLIQEEIVDDFKCSNCSKKVRIKKRITLAKLPNTLFLHLKRFSYRNENAAAVKLFSKFTFPKKIDLKQFCTENFQIENEDIYPKKDEYYKYILKGVVQHRGFANGGHYVSYIDVNRGGKGNILNDWNDENKANWYEFNDSNVSEFNSRFLPEQTFGDSSSNRTGYLLIYERIQKSPIKVLINNQEVRSKENITNYDEENIKIFNKKYDIYYRNNPIKEEDLYNLIFYSQKKNEYFKFIPYYSMEKRIPKPLHKEIMLQNSRFENGNILSSFNDNAPDPAISNIDEKLPNKIENLIFSSFNSENSLDELQSNSINFKYDLITIIILIIFKKIKESSTMNNYEMVNSKLFSFQTLFCMLSSSEEVPDIEKILYLSKFLITKEKFDIFFILDKLEGNKIFNEDNIGIFKSFIIKLVEILTQDKIKNKEIDNEKIRICDFLVDYKKSKNKTQQNESLDTFVNDLLIKL